MDFAFNLPGLKRPGSSRPKRVAEAIREELSLALVREVADPRLALLSFSRVEMSPDLKRARIYFVLPAGADPAPVNRALKKARGFFRSHLARTLNLRYTPELVFFFDDLNDDLERMDRIFAELKDQRRGDDGQE